MRSSRILATACAVVLTFASSAAAQQTFFVVRHAERADAGQAGAAPMVTPSTDPPLSAAGHERAARLAAMLRSASVRYIFSTEFLRTRQTAAPLAQARHLEIIAVPSKEPEALLTQVRGVTGNVLIVWHSNTIPDLLKRLGIKDEITIADTEHDNLFVVVRPDAGEPTLIRLRY